MARNVAIAYEPLSQWPAGRERTPDDGRRDAQFKTPSTYVQRAVGLGSDQVGRKRIPLEQTLDDLDRELWAIGADDVVVQVDVANREEFRRNLRVADGQIRADVRTKSPAVVLSFRRDRTPTVFATDHFTNWADNLRAIALGLEALRKLERYHIARAGDQYRGWQALPATTTTALSTEQAAAVVAKRMADVNGGPDASARRILGERDYARDAIRSAANRTHPDRGGLSDDFKLVQEAKRVLEAHHGGPL